MERFKYLILICILFVVESVHSQVIKVTGTVEDKTGPLVGVTVKVKGGSTGTVTDLDGNFSMSVSANASLEFSYIGYETKTIDVKNQNNIKVLLHEVSTNLDEVVVVGYGVEKKRDITGSIVSVSAEELKKNTPTNIGDALLGKVAGLSVISSSAPGESAQFKVRGISTLGDEAGSNPLFIVDGMEVSSIDDINPKDIVSIEVLKDAASASIYGSRSANGVVIISTKQGEKGKPSFDLSYSARISEIAKTMPQMNRLEANNYDAIRGFLESGSSDTYLEADSLKPIYLQDQFLQDMLFRTAYTHQVDLSVSGAGDKVKYYASLGYLNDQGIHINTYNKRLSARFNVDYQINKRLSMGTRISPSVSNRRDAPWGTRRFVLQNPSYFALYHPETGDYMPYLGGITNPLGVSMLDKNDYKNYNLNIYQFLNYKFTDYLQFKASFSANYVGIERVTFVPGQQRYDEVSNARNTNSAYIGWNHEDVLTFNKKIKNTHNINALLGFGLRENTSSILQVEGAGMPSALELVNSYETILTANTYDKKSCNRMASFFGRFGYNYKGRYLANVNVRTDASSRFGRDNRWGTFPSVSLGWRISDEKFMKWSKSFITDMKIRASYGITGNQTAGDFASMRLYEASRYATYLGLVPTQLENSELGWETTRQTNIGLDLLMFNSRLNIVFDLYDKYTYDVLYTVRLPQTSGFASTYDNVGDVSNKGLELSLKGILFKNKDWEAALSGSFSINKNMIKSIPEGGEQFINDIYYMAEGYEIGTMYGYKALAVFPYDESNAFTKDWQQLTPIYNERGVFQGKYLLNGEPCDIKPEEVNRLKYDNVNGQVFKGGDVMWDDLNKDGVIDAKDRQVIGHGIHDIVGGLGGDLKYKNWSLSFFFNYSFGGDVFNYNKYDINAYQWSPKTKVDPIVMQNSWLAPGDVKKYPKPAKSFVQNTRLNSSLWVEDGSFIRLNNLRLSYSFPEKWCKKMRVKGLSISAQGNNLLTWTNYSGYDPEINVSSFTAGYDSNNYPKARSVKFDLNINF